MLVGEKVDRAISYMAEVTVDDVEGVNKDHVRQKNGEEWSCISSISPILVATQPCLI